MLQGSQDGSTCSTTSASTTPSPKLLNEESLEISRQATNSSPLADVSSEDEAVDSLRNSLFRLSLNKEALAASREQAVETLSDMIARMIMLSPRGSETEFEKIAQLLTKRPDVIDQDTFPLVFKYLKAYNDINQTAKLLVILLESGNQYHAFDLEGVFLWCITHKSTQVIESLVKYQNICFIKEFKPIVFKIYIEKMGGAKFLDYLLFSSWSFQMPESHYESIFKDLFLFASGKGLPEVLGMLQHRCEFLQKRGIVLEALEMAISEGNASNVLFLWKNKCLNAQDKQQLTLKLVRDQDKDLLEALEKDNQIFSMCENVVFKVANLYAMGNLNPQDVPLILGLVEAQIGLVSALEGLSYIKKRHYYLDLARELLGLAKKYSDKSKEMAKQFDGTFYEKMLDPLDECSPKRERKSQLSLLDEILHPKKQDDAEPQLEEQEAPSDSMVEVFTPLRESCVLKLQKEALDDAKEHFKLRNTPPANK